MPMVHIHLSNPVEKEKQAKLMSALSGAVAEILGKPEAYVMIMLDPETAMLMAAKSGPAAFVEVRSVGTVSADQAKKLSKAISEIIAQEIGVESSRIYSNFLSIPGSMWGFNGNTFG